MGLDLDALLKSFGDDAPSGEDMEYDADFINLEIAATPKEEQVMGNEVLAAEEPDYPEVKKAAVKVLEKSHDLRAAVFYANAAIRTEGIAGFEGALAYIRGVVETYWETLHPQLDPDDDNDPTMRVSTIKNLMDNDTVMRGLRLAPLTDSRTMGRFSLRDIHIASGEIPPPKGEDKPPDATAISPSFQDTDPARFVALREAVAKCREHVKAIGAKFDAEVGSLGPDFVPLERVLYDINKALDQYMPADEEEEEAVPSDDGAGVPGEEGEADEGDGAAVARPAAAAVKGVGSIATRRDVQKAIEKICDYYKKNEPSSPVPAILMRAHRLVMADFETILQDLAPEGLEKYRMVAGASEDD